MPRRPYRYRQQGTTSDALAMGCGWAYQSVRVGAVEVPARCLMELAELPSVVKVS